MTIVVWSPGTRVPAGITELICKNNFNITELPPLLQGLQHLVVNCTCITNLPRLPDTLITLDCRNNPLLVSFPPEIPSGLKRLWIDETKISHLPIIPPTITELSCLKTNITQLNVISLPKHLKCDMTIKINSINNIIDTQQKEIDNLRNQINELEAKFKN